MMMSSPETREMNANVAAQVRLHHHQFVRSSVQLLMFFFVRKGLIACNTTSSSSRCSSSIARASFCCRLLDDDDDDGFFKNHHLSSKSFDFLLERRTDDGLTSYSSLSLFLSRTNKNILYSTQSILKRNQYNKRK